MNCYKHSTEGGTSLQKKKNVIVTWEDDTVKPNPTPEFSVNLCYLTLNFHANHFPCVLHCVIWHPISSDAKSYSQCMSD